MMHLQILYDLGKGRTAFMCVLIGGINGEEE